MKARSATISLFAALLLALPVAAQVNDQASDKDRLQYLDVFEMEVAADPRISPDGSRVVYVRRGSDIMTDRSRTALWAIDSDGANHRALTDGNSAVASPRWAPDGNRLAYISSEGGSSQLFVRWMDTGQIAELTNVTESAGSITWSPDGNWIAMTMFVPEATPTFARMPPRPDGAEWNVPPVVINKMRYRSDGRGYLEDGYTHIFVLPADGGTPRQVTSGSYNHGGSLSWSPDSRAIVFSANRDDPDFDVRNSEVFEVSVETGELTQLTDRFGPDGSPIVSPDGSQIAYTGFDDRYQGYQVGHLYVMNRDGSGSRMVSDLDRSFGGLNWAQDGRGLFFQYDDQGMTKVAHVSLDGTVTDLADEVGGVGLGRPYGGGSYTVANNGRFAFTVNSTQRPADVAIGQRGTEVHQITQLNEDLLGHKKLGAVEEIWWDSSHDGRPVHGWIATPPDFDPSKKYPLMLEIHGGPFSNYGPRFAPEIQFYAAAGYVVLYTNPRGSTSYGEEFGNLIHHAYPGYDYDDMMSGVDAVIDRGYIDEENMMVTGGSGGGVLTAWIVGKTDRFQAAVVQKPVIDWISFSLTSDGYSSYYQYWLPGPVWEEGMLEHYWERSPLSLVGNVTTPTMLITGEDDLRTPMGQSEEYYQALQIMKVPTQLVRVQNSYHGIASSAPSNLIAKVANVLEWFERYKANQRVISDND
ncbi:MAG: prolyl oligopeptidase family serine peptidase [Proteobacteria bacterium]|nr:prolyl oligopeptidase family serine peptidase [Pseudomonadota bacterium]